MKKFAATLCILALLCGIAQAGDKKISVPKKVTGGSVTLTNALSIGASARAGDSGVALEIERVEFTLPTAGITNVFAIRHITTYDLPETYASVVKTGTVNGVSLVYTNYNKYSGGTATFTNDYTVATTTNDTSLQVYDEDDFDKSFVIEPGDVVRYSFTDTGTIYLRVVYTQHERP